MCSLRLRLSFRCHRTSDENKQGDRNGHGNACEDHNARHGYRDQPGSISPDEKSVARVRGNRTVLLDPVMTAMKRECPLIFTRSRYAGRTWRRSCFWRRAHSRKRMQEEDRGDKQSEPRKVNSAAHEGLKALWPDLSREIGWDPRTCLKSLGFSLTKS